MLSQSGCRRKARISTPMPSGSYGRSKRSALHRVVPLGEGHLRLIVHEYVEHYHRERNHQGLDNQLLQRPPPPVRSDADVQRRERLGGLLRRPRQFLLSRGRMSGRPINRTLRGRSDGIENRAACCRHESGCWFRSRPDTRCSWRVNGRREHNATGGRGFYYGFIGYTLTHW